MYVLSNYYLIIEFIKNYQIYILLIKYSELKKSKPFDGVDGFIVIVIPVIFIGVPIDFEPFLRRH